MRIRQIHIAIAVSMAVMTAMLTGCFTGIESTPRITSDDVKRNAVQTEVTQTNYLDDIKPQNISEWKGGKEFFVTDSRIGMVLNITPSNAMLQMGDTLRYISAEDVTSIMGVPVANINLSGPRGITANYTFDTSLAKLKQLGNVKIPFTVELSVVSETRSRILDKEFWVVTSEWLDMNRQPRRGRKFVKVKVIDIHRGDDIYPVCLTLIDTEHQPADTFALLMNPGSDLPTTSRRFNSLLSVTDPHERYPQISNANWQLIRNGKVAAGMTRLEARLALGEPSDINRHAGYSSLSEIWQYDNGTFLMFEDGLLKQSRL